jgi:succinate dehydrogenase/fumarate reductase iron-sulfur protein
MKVKCDVWRSSPGAGAHGSYRTYVLDADPAETVLGILVKINHDLDPGLAFRFACGVVKCGECAVEVNGSSCLACEKAVEEEMRIRPLPDLPVIKDLVIDRRSVFDQVSKLIPQLSRIKEGTALRGIDADRMDRFVRMTKCFECLMCQSACPVRSAGEEKFVGPLGLLWLGQMSLDPGKRFLVRNEIKASLQMCLRCGLCSEACPCSEDIIGLAIDTLEKEAQGRGEE